MPDHAGGQTQPRRDLNRQAGIVIFFTGFSGAGKTTIANLLAKSLEVRGRTVTQLDGDVIRKCISSELGFSKEHRDLNIRRIGFVASEIAKHGGIAICAAIAPYDQVRREVRGMAEANGRFVLVYVSTPLDVCERRDAKGLYARARSGLIPHFTGISDPYEEPRDAEIVIDTIATMPEEAVCRILSYLSSAISCEGSLPNTLASVGALPHRGDSRR
jgi:sulfate adenylyltransferase